MRCVLFLLVLCSAATPPAAAATYLVIPDGTGDFPTIQDAIDAVTDGEVIELADGVFQGDGNRDLDFGGKAITLRAQSGMPESCVIDCQGTTHAPRRGISFKSGEGPESILEGITITGGYSGDPDPYGAALGCWLASPTIDNCVFAECVSTGGGAVYCNRCSPSLRDCVFRDNDSNDGWGGGLRCFEASPSLHGCEFVGNLSPERGGGLCALAGSMPSIANCTFRQNSSTDGGAVYCEDEITLSESVFIDNFAMYGSAVCSRGAMTITGCTFAGNRYRPLYFEDASPEVRSCTFTANVCGDHPCAHAIMCVGDATPIIENTIIALGDGYPPIRCGAPREAIIRCSNVWGNPEGNWEGCIAAQLGSEGNFSADPQFCAASPSDEEDWSIAGDSPCAPGQSGCGQIGAWSVGCDSTPVRASGWGGVKARFRE